MTDRTFDMSRKFVRVMNILPGGLVEFEFAIGDPDVCVELVMPQTAFDTFCHTHQVEFTTADTLPDNKGEQDDFRWGMHQATHQRFR